MGQGGGNQTGPAQPAQGHTAEPRELGFTYKSLTTKSPEVFIFTFLPPLNLCLDYTLSLEINSLLFLHSFLSYRNYASGFSLNITSSNKAPLILLPPDI